MFVHGSSFLPCFYFFVFFKSQVSSFHYNGAVISGGSKPNVIVAIPEKHPMNICRAMHRSSTLVTSTFDNDSVIFRRQRHPLRLQMANESNDDEGGYFKKLGPGTIGVALVTFAYFFILVVGPIAAGLIENANDNSPSVTLADAVITRQQQPKQPQSKDKQPQDKFANYQSRKDAVPKNVISQKLQNVPVFYVSSNSDNDSRGDIFYVSYDDATEASSKTKDSVVKSMTLDKVMYKSSNGDISSSSYKVIPSSSARADAENIKLDLVNNDIPLFVADKLAFAGNNGGPPQVPLFLERQDAITSYNRLRQSSSTLPPEATIRATTLLDELNSMEKGTRPRVAQLEFYASEVNLLKSTELIEGEAGK
mmetsp:Transcript_48399/g.58396  ORF Transcript_48399/g.58396 Transcript_48399/m.58396 type:complete len:365 (-) Transcript_48399:515-1609(-)